MEGGRRKIHHTGKQLREEAGGVSEEGALGLHASKLLEEREGKDLRIGELLERRVAPPFGVEPLVGVVDEAEENGESLFQGRRSRGNLGSR
jgi:hypothetical protein